MRAADVKRQNQRAKDLQRFYEVTSPMTGRVYRCESKRTADGLARTFAFIARGER